MRGLIHFPLILLVFLSLMFAAQRFWFVRTWRLIETVARPAWRYLLQGLWIVAIVLVLTAVFVPFFGHWSPRRDLANWMISISRLWLPVCCEVLSLQFVNRLTPERRLTERQLTGCLVLKHRSISGGSG